MFSYRIRATYPTSRLTSLHSNSTPATRPIPSPPARLTSFQLLAALDIWPSSMSLLTQLLDLPSEQSNTHPFVTHNCHRSNLFRCANTTPGNSRPTLPARFPLHKFRDRILPLIGFPSAYANDRSIDGTSAGQ